MAARVCEGLTIKRKREQADAALHAEDLVDDGIVRCNPAHPGEVAQGGKDEIGEPVPDEGDAKGDEEELVA